MGLFDLFKKKEVAVSPVLQKTPAKDVPVMKDGAEKSYDYFAFKVHGVSDHQDILIKKGVRLFENPNFVSVKLDDANERIQVFIDNEYIGVGDKTAYNKFKANCLNKRFEVHSCSIYGGGKNNEGEDKNYGCKIRIKFYY